MRKALIAAVCLLVLVGAGAFATSRVNAYLNANRQWLAQQASTALGREVRFEEVGVSLRGGLGAELTKVAVADDPAYSREPFLEVDRVVVAVKILPALMGRYELARVILDAPRVNVVRGASGFNFDTIGQTAAAQAPPASETAPAIATSDSGVAPPLQVSALDVNGGRLSFVDRTESPSSEVVVEQLDLSASDVGFDSQVEIDLDAAVLGAAEQNLSLDGWLGPLGSPQGAMRAPLDLEARLGSFSVDRLKDLPVVGQSIPAELSSDAGIELGAAVEGTVLEPVVVASFDGSAAGFRYGESVRKPAGTRFAVEAKLARAAETVAVDELVVTLAAATLHGAGTIGIGDGMPVDLEISGSAIPLDGWGDLVAAAENLEVDGVVDVDVRAHGPVSDGAPRLDGVIALRDVSAVQSGGGVRVSGLSTRVALTGDRIEMAPTRFEVAGEPVEMSATVTSLRQLAAELSLTAPKLVLDAVGAGGEGVAAEEVIENLSVDGDIGESRAQLDVRSSRGSVRGIDYDDLDVQVALVDRGAEVKKVSVKAFDGSVDGSGSYTIGDGDPELEFRGRVSGLDVQPILDYLGVSQIQMSGRVEGDVRVSSSERKEVR